MDTKITAKVPQQLKSKFNIQTATYKIKSVVFVCSPAGLSGQFYKKHDCVSKNQNPDEKIYLRSSRIDSVISVVNFDDYFLNSKLETITFQKST